LHQIGVTVVARARRRDGRVSGGGRRRLAATGPEKNLDDSGIESGALMFTEV
jgi:hypothetical protein